MQQGFQEMTTPIKTYNTLALLGAIALMSLALARGIASDLHVPAARILVAECQGFEALATAGGKRLTCSADVAVLDEGPKVHESPVAPEPVAPVAPAVPAAPRKKA